MLQGMAGGVGKSDPANSLFSSAKCSRQSRCILPTAVASSLQSPRATISA